MNSKLNFVNQMNQIFYVSLVIFLNIFKDIIKLENTTVMMH